MSRPPQHHYRLEYDHESIAWLYLDCREASSNTLPLDVLEDLGHALEELEARSDLKGVVVLSEKAVGFATGPDREEMASIQDQERVGRLIDRGQALTSRFANLAVPSVALIHGHCLGAGLELALACRYRVAEQSTARLGFPDIHLGLHPCYGGTARLPALIGDWQALDLLRKGNSVGPAAALRLGLIDAAAPWESLQDSARDLIARDPGRRRPARWNHVFRFPPCRWMVYAFIDSDLQRRPRPDYFPTTYAILRLWREYARQRLEKRLAAERRSLLRLAERPRTRNLARTFLLQERLQREAGALDAPVPSRIAVFGAGSLGGGLAGLLALHGWRVTLHDPDEHALRSARARAQGMFLQHVRDPEMVGDIRSRLQVHTDDSGIAEAGLVIEAIPEDLEAKRDLLARIEAELEPDAVIATTSSTLLVEELAAGLEHPRRLVGLHFARPVDNLQLVEVVAGRDSDERALAIGQATVAAAHKLALRVNSGPGFLVLRLLLPYLLQGAAQFERPRREVIDAAGQKFGLPHGPLEWADSIGLDVCLRLAERLGHEVPDALREHVTSGRLGQRVGRGFHDWRGARRVTASIPPGDHDFEAIAAGLIEPMLREAERCRDEGVVADADLVDVGALFGLGFPGDRGGPLAVLQAGGLARR
ncbi:MAG: 3-hydroxyacyl-CoA dehydrogenase NAD-binding domain-containing protein [Halofilum sp. (in: g-proteobacteria)]|nr:3-hydroxyacyl-CoA dehydrogenase NAD-binding domain-containing protein [Halofilum sp. (in: g-proteobacteria)]